MLNFNHRFPVVIKNSCGHVKLEKITQNQYLLYLGVYGYASQSFIPCGRGTLKISLPRPCAKCLVKKEIEYVKSNGKTFGKLIWRHLIE